MSAPEQPQGTPAPTPEQPAAVPEKTNPTAPPQHGQDRGRKPSRFGKPRPPKEPVRSLEQDLRPKPPSLRDLDDEIAGELEAALGGISEKDLLGADTSKNVQQKSATAQDHGRKQGTVISVHGQDVFIDIPGGRSQGLLPILQFPEGPPKIGTVVDVHIEGYDAANGLLLLTRQGAAVVADWNTVAEGMTVEARVVETNKGGVTVDVNGIRGFMPISQIDMYRVENAEQFINQRLLCLVTEVNQEERNLVVSRRALLEKEREEKREKLWEEIAEGQIREGVVRSVRDFGAFVDLGGADGLIHVSEMSWKRVTDPNTILQQGQSVKVVVLKLDREARKIGLGLKQLQASPWDNIQDRFHSNQIVTGQVTRVMDFGAFVEIEPGIEGLVHISELAPKRVWRAADVVQPGQEVEAKILSIDTQERRISLSLRAAIQPEKPKAEEPEEEEVETPAKPRPRNFVLRGGIGHGTMEIVPTEEKKDEE